MSDQYQWWREAIAGKSPEIHADSPQSGYFRTRVHKDGPWLPVAIWRDDDGLQCRVGPDWKDAEKVWTYCAGNPVAKADAKHAFEHGSWPGDVAVGHNSGELSLPDEINDAVDVALSWMRSTPIADKVTMDTAANHRARLQDLSKKADKQRETEKKPHDLAAKAVQAKWKPFIDKADEAANTIRGALSKYMAEEEAKARKAAEEAARVENERRMAEFKRQQDERKRIEAELAEKQLPPPPPEVVEIPQFVAPEAVKIQAGGQRGKKAGLREITRYQINDYAAALDAVKNHPDVVAAVEKVAFAQARAGATVPGVSSFIEKVAV